MPSNLQWKPQKTNQTSSTGLNTILHQHIFPNYVHYHLFSYTLGYSFTFLLAVPSKHTVKEMCFCSKGTKLSTEVKNYIKDIAQFLHKSNKFYNTTINATFMEQDRVVRALISYYLIHLLNKTLIINSCGSTFLRNFQGSTLHHLHGARHWRSKYDLQDNPHPPWSSTSQQMIVTTWKRDGPILQQRTT